MSKTRVYKIWYKMKDRCNNPNNIGYKDYGGRGIKLCQHWDGSFQAFFKDMGNPPSPEHSIERINNHEGYSKTNCKWADKFEQGRNKRNNVILIHQGKAQTLSDWAREIRISIGTLWKRVQLGWHDHKIITTPLRSKKPSATL